MNSDPLAKQSFNCGHHSPVGGHPPLEDHVVPDLPAGNNSFEVVPGHAQRQTGQNVIATRADVSLYDDVKRITKLDGLRYERDACMIVLEQKPVESPVGDIVIVTAGTADMPVAEEARVTASMLGQKVELVCDVGVAGIHRLLGNVEHIRQANVVIVVAGMEGALASVVGGLVDCPVIAVPTSVGYGASFEGLSALLTMLNSCASGVTVVNIDNGFGAAYSASMINMKIEGV